MQRRERVTKQLLVSAYVACGALAVGSLGPWSTVGSQVYLGVGGDGLLTLAGSGIASIALWRWSALQRRLVLVIGQGFATLCMSIAIYDALDVYSGRDEGFGVGWGLVAALIASSILTALCSLLLWRTRSGRPRVSRGAKISLLVTFAVAALGLWVTSPFGSGDPEPLSNWFADGWERPIPDQALKVASGRSDGTVWSVWLFGREGSNCWATRTGERFPFEEAYCGYNVPAESWQLLARGPIYGEGRGKEIFCF